MGVRKLVSLVAGTLVLLLGLFAPALACAPSAVLRVTPSSGPAGSRVDLALAFDPAESPIEIGWSDGITKQVLTTVPAATRFTSIVVPTVEPSVYFIHALQHRLSDGAPLRSATEVFVLEPGGTPQPGEPPGPLVDALPPLGYRLVASDGGVFAFGGAGFFGSMGGRLLAAPIVGMAATPSGGGYWLVASDGGIFAFGDAGFSGSMGGRPLAAPIVGMASTPSGRGYWLVAADGGIFAFGDAGFFGSAGGMPLVAPVVGMAPAASGSGYWLAGQDGGVFAFGTAPYLGSTSGATNRSVVGIARLHDPGYLTVDVQGYVFNIGFAWTAIDPYGGAMPAQPVVGMAISGEGSGHWVVSADGGVFALRGAPFLGSLGGIPLARPIVGITATAG